MKSVMQYVPLGQSGFKVSPVCLGTMMFGGAADEASSRRIIDKARGFGINFIDTADVYNSGASEEIVGRAVAADRDKWVVATKVGSGEAKGLLAGARVRKSAEESARRLQTDRIDIYYLHKEDHTTPLEETIGAIADLLRRGVIRSFGVSNYRGWRVAEICRLCDTLGIARPIVSQPYYNALNRMPEIEHLPACGYLGLGVFPYSPIARGVLTGKYRPGEKPSAETRVGRNDKRMMQTEWRPESLEIAQTLKSHAESRGINAVQFAVAWVLNNRLVTGVVAGPRTEEQLDDYVRALDYRFTADDEALVDQFVTTGHPSTPRYNDPAYPIEGRVPRTG
jgi:aryl-alcohol dehydrogenase-like predicted oxidoreductase